MSDYGTTDPSRPDEPIPMPAPRAGQGQAEPPPESLTGRQTYNLVSDTVTGPNIRISDNLIQLVVVALFVATGVLIGVLFAEDFFGDPVVAGIAGAICGLVVGTFVSGLALMIYRGVQHATGRHD